MERQRNKPKIVYIAGAGHSGTTLMDCILDAAPETFSVGELKFLKRFIEHADIGETKKYGYLDDTGATLDKSPVWGSIVKNFDVYINEEVQNAELRWFEKISLAMLGVISERPATYHNEQLYREILKNAKQVTGGEIQYIIDSSKNLPQLIALQQYTDFDIFVIHMVRDVRGVVNSFHRRGIKKPFKIAWRWFLVNTLIVRFTRQYIDQSHYMRIYYEDFADEPQKFLENIKKMTGISVDYQELIATVENKPSYRFAGNPMRLDQFTGVKKDARWKQELPSLYRILFALANKLF